MNRRKMERLLELVWYVVFDPAREQRKHSWRFTRYFADSDAAILSSNQPKYVFLLFPFCGAATLEEPVTQNIENVVVCHHWGAEPCHRHVVRGKTSVTSPTYHLAFEHEMAADKLDNGSVRTRSSLHRSRPMWATNIFFFTDILTIRCFLGASSYVVFWRA